MEYYIARDKNGYLYLFNNEPEITNNDTFISSKRDTNFSSCLYIDKNLFPEVTWENSPRKVKIELV